MHEAFIQAQHAEAHQEVPVGAVIVREGKVIGKGHNKSILANDPSAHAEIIAMRVAAHSLQNYRLTDTTLFVTLEPCVMCVGAILHARIKRLVFGARDPRSGAAGSVFNLIADQRHNHSVELTGGVMEQECGTLLKKFFRLRRKQQNI